MAINGQTFQRISLGTWCILLRTQWAHAWRKHGCSIVDTLNAYILCVRFHPVASFSTLLESLVKNSGGKRSSFAVCARYARKQIIPCFCAKMKERNENIVKVEGVSANVMRHIVNYLYSGEIAFTPEEAVDIFSAADYLLIAGRFCLLIGVSLLVDWGKFACWLG